MKKKIVACLIVLSTLLLPLQIFAAEAEQPADPGVVIEVLSTPPQASEFAPFAASKGEYVNIKVKFAGTPPATYFYTRGSKSGTLKRYQTVDKNTALYDGYIN
ncbi:hypothetical protein [uncultured Vagococcus sp.]|uniref:hypothetical protein n=1 Tax=uncultured Vagococcus sp. TaxID=189676 RepID=UPI0028D7E599|nr:hypothetical protein [uncultured Vagococcus sp.]